MNMYPRQNTNHLITWELFVNRDGYDASWRVISNYLNLFQSSSISAILVPCYLPSVRLIGGKLGTWSQTAIGPPILAQHFFLNCHFCQSNSLKRGPGKPGAKSKIVTFPGEAINWNSLIDDLWFVVVERLVERRPQHHVHRRRMFIYIFLLAP